MTLIYDKKAVLERCDNDVELIKELMQMFIEDYPKSISDIEYAVESKDPGKIDRSAHAIKSALGNLGGMKAYQIAYDLELSGKKNNITDSPSLLKNLKDAISEFLSVWEEEKKSF